MSSFFLSVLISVVFAFIGHALYCFYRWIFLGALALVGLHPTKKDAQEAPADEPAMDTLRRYLARWRIREQSGTILGILGALLAAGAFIWLLGDLVSDSLMRRWIQLLAMLVLTATIGLAGFRLRVRGPDPLGTGLMALGWLLIPPDAIFYEEYILQRHMHSECFVALVMGAIALWIAVRTHSRVFAWLGPLAVLLGLLLIPDKFDAGPEAVSYLASLAGPLFLVAFARFAPGALGPLFTRPLLATAGLASIAALVTYADGRPEAFPSLHFQVLILGGGTLAIAAYQLTDLRGLALLVLYDGALFNHYYEYFGTATGWVGTILAVLGIGLLVIERWRRVGPDRRRGLDPFLSVPAVTLLLGALAVDGLSVLLLLERVQSIGFSARSVSSMLGTTELTAAWAQAQRAIYYLARVDPTLRAAAVSGLLAAGGLAYVALSALLPFYAYGAGLALGGAGLWTLLAMRPFELYGQDYAAWLMGMAGFATAAALVAGRSRFALAAPALGLPAHLWTPATWIALGYHLYSPDAIPGWWWSLTLAVIGLQASVHGRLFADAPVLDALGRVAITMAWPAAIGSLSRGELDQTMIPPLLIVALPIQIGILWWGLARHEVPSIGAGGAGLLITLAFVADRVESGAVLTKMVVIVVGIGLLWLGTRSRRTAAAAALLLGVCGAGVMAQGEGARIQTRASLEALSAANPADPIIAVRMRAAHLTPAREPAARFRWNLPDKELANLSALASIQAALQVASTPLRILVSPGSQADRSVSMITPASPRLLDYIQMAHRLAGAPQLPPPESGDVLARGPADRIYVRFKDAAALEKMIHTYENVGRSLLAVTVPGMAVPSPRRAFQSMLGMDLLDAARDGGQGALIIADPFLGLAPDIVLALVCKDGAAAAARAASWAQRAGADRTATAGTVALLGTTVQGVAAVRQAMDETSHLMGGASTPHLADAPDYRYSRLLHLAGTDGSLFIGESAVTRLIAPGFWLAARRREDCLAQQADLEAAVAVGKLTGQPLPDTPEQLESEAVSRGWILGWGQCRSGGSLQWASPGILTCTVHGSRLSPRPLAGTEPAWVYGEELDEYSRFSRRYASLYSRWVDPVAAGIALSDAGVTFDTVVLPLARLPEYTALSQAVGRDLRVFDGPIESPPGSEGSLVSLAVRVPGWEDIVGVRSQDSRSLYTSRLSSTIFVGNRYVPLEPALWRMLEMLRAAKPGPTVGAVLVPGDLSLLSYPAAAGALSPAPLPLVIAQEVASAQGAQEYLADLFAGQEPFVAGEARGWGARLYGRRHAFGAADDRWMVLATGRDLLEGALGEPRRAGTLPGAHARLLIHPDRLARSPGVLAFAGDALAERCRGIQASLQALADLKAAWPLAAGAVPEGDPFVSVLTRCPAGGTYTLEQGWVRCSVHGTSQAPVSSPPTATSAAQELLASLGRIEVELAMLTDGVRTRLSLEMNPATRRPPAP